MIITDIAPRRKGLSQVFIDGEEALKLDTETLEVNSVKIGMNITDEELYELIQKSEARRASEKALYLLERRSHSKKELKDKISRVTGKEAAEAARLARQNDDAARLLTEAKRRKARQEVPPNTPPAPPR